MGDPTLALQQALSAMPACPPPVEGLIAASKGKKWAGDVLRDALRHKLDIRIQPVVRTTESESQRAMSRGDMACVVCTRAVGNISLDIRNLCSGRWFRLGFFLRRHVRRCWLQVLRGPHPALQTLSVAYPSASLHCRHHWSHILFGIAWRARRRLCRGPLLRA